MTKAVERKSKQQQKKKKIIKLNHFPLNFRNSSLNDHRNII